MSLTLPGLACDFGKSKTVAPLVQVQGAAPNPASLKRAKAHGSMLWWREHATLVAVATGLRRVGKGVNKILLPIAEVDDGNHSGSVTFYRWPDHEDGQQLRGDDAQRWLVVPMLLRPDRVLENEQFNNYLAGDSPRAREIDAIVIAGAELLEAYPSGRWHMHPFREGSEKNPKRLIRTRVYAFAADNSGPDVELVIDDAPRNGEPKLLAMTVVHEINHWRGEELQMQLNAPTALTVARVLERGAIARSFEAKGADGTHWTIDAESGEFELRAATEEDEDEERVEVPL